MAAIGPLTTTFSAPSSCSTAFSNFYEVFEGEKESSYVQGPLFPTHKDCFPSGYDPAPTKYYSPGFCPQEYTAACSSLRTSSTVTETAIACCPNYGVEYTCATESKPESGCTTVWQGGAGALEPIVIKNSTIASTATITLRGGAISAYPVQIRFQASDLSNALTPSRTATIPPATNVLLPPDTTSSSSGLSSTAIIGIAVGGGLGFFILFSSLGLWCYMRRRRKQYSSQPTPRSGAPSHRGDGYGTRSHPQLFYDDNTSHHTAPTPSYRSQRSHRSSRLHHNTTPGSIPEHSEAPPVPPKEKSVSYRAIPPPYELSEEASPRLGGGLHSPKYSQRRSHSLLHSPSSARTYDSKKSHGRGDSGVMYGVGIQVPIGTRAPAELEAEVPEEVLRGGGGGDGGRDRAASPESGMTGWTGLTTATGSSGLTDTRQGRGAASPLGWL
ncbi:hypothetical protein QBC36DRAFT_17249 [Triangularia setosa]|uniref:Uncharacterized protein n=1 Tax=Triangularia setosa TaxID=2587417 RepID=A0AAN7A842_9PEZI|nr:hypothetical protein QBC36DRAFT_17249 [Podospora setosa]